MPEKLTSATPPDELFSQSLTVNDCTVVALSGTTPASIKAAAMIAVALSLIKAPLEIYWNDDANSGC
jgi:hypothetical protein